MPFFQIFETDESPYSRRNKTIAFYILQRANCSFEPMASSDTTVNDTIEQTSKEEEGDEESSGARRERRKG